MRCLLACALLCAASPTWAADPASPRSELSLYVPMSDGVRLGIDVVLASHVARPGPSLVQVTRYGRGGRDPQMLEQYGGAGMHLVFVDARGSGASFGSRPIEFSAAEVGDLRQIIEWISRQPWSNGKVAFTGNSYAGDMAELATASGAAPLLAAVIRHSEFDPYRHLTFPGGVRNDLILNLWGAAVGEEDRAESCLRSIGECRSLEHLEPVSGDGDYSLVRQALIEHQGNFRSDRDLAAVSFVDDHTPAGPTLESISAHSRLDAIAAAAVPVQVWASWMDAGTAASALERYRSLPRAPAEIFIAAWTHGGRQSVDPFFPDDQPNIMDRPQQLQRHIAFLRDALSGSRSARVIHYVPLGSQTWRQTTQWPPSGVTPRRLYLSGGQSLSDAAPTGDGKDFYAVDFSATSGPANRWRTQLGGEPVRYPTRAADDRKLLLYTSAAFDRDMELAGRARVRLNLTVDRNDAAIFVYLEDVAPDGRVTYLSEGQLRLLHRRPGPHLDGEPSYRRQDGQPVVPGERITADVLVLPVAAHIAAGHRLRLAVAGADAGTFARYPADGALNISLLRSLAAPSWIEVPLRAWTNAAPASRSPTQ